MIIVVTTPGREYLSSTIKNIDSSAKSKNKIIICDGDSIDLITPNSWKLSYFKKPQLSPTGSYPYNKYSMWEAFRLAVEFEEDLIFFEDDIELCDNAASFIEDINIPSDIAWLSFFKPQFPSETKEIIRKFPANNFLFSQALKFPLQTCRVLYSNYDQMHTNYQFGGSDEMLSILGQSLILDYGVYLPNIVQHVGVKSSVGNGELTNSRISTTYPGKKFNCDILSRKSYHGR